MTRSSARKAPKTRGAAAAAAAAAASAKLAQAPGSPPLGVDARQAETVDGPNSAVTPGSSPLSAAGETADLSPVIDSVPSQPSLEAEQNQLAAPLDPVEETPVKGRKGKSKVAASTTTSSAANGSTTKVRSSTRNSAAKKAPSANKIKLRLQQGSESDLDHTQSRAASSSTALPELKETPRSRRNSRRTTTMQAPVAEAPVPMPAKEANTAALASDELDSVSPQLSDPQAAPKIDVASFDEDIAAVNISESAPPSVISAPSKAIALPPSNPTPLSFKASSSQPRMSPMVSPSTLPSPGINSPLPVPVVTPARVPSPLAGSSSTRTPLLQVPTSPSFDDQAELATQPIVTAKRQASATEMDAVPTPPLKKRHRSSTAHSHTPARSTTSSSSTPGPVPVLATEGSTSAATDIPTAIPASSKSTASSAKVSAVSTPNPHMTPKPTAAAFLAARGMKKPTPNTDHQQGSTVTPKLAQNTSKGTPGSVSGGASKVGDSPAVGEVLSRLVGTKVNRAHSASSLRGCAPTECFRISRKSLR